MSLSDFRPERTEVRFKGGSFTVRGLSADDLAGLFRHHATEMTVIFSAVEDLRRPGDAAEHYSKLALNIMQDAPILIADVIARASDEEDVYAAALKLPFPVQLEAIKAIGALTFEEIGGRKKFLASLQSLFAPILSDKQTRLAPT